MAAKERGFRPLRRRVVGPLGIWSFPILNLVLELIERWRERRLAKLGGTGHSRAPAKLSPMANVEVWEWTDYRGRRRRLEIHREVKETNR